MIHCLRLSNYPILKQLELEEGLLRGDTRNWCLINEGSTPSIVMGISGRPEELINQEKIAEHPLPVIKRFSGGGTVIVDENTLFVTFIFQKDFHPFPAFPEPIMKWSGALYNSFFPALTLRENDYVIGNKKCGGNAQYIKKDRWLHHTSFLWNFKAEHMDYLLHPKKTPSYRSGRSHLDFLCGLEEHISKEAFIAGLQGALSGISSLKEVSLEEALASSSNEMRRSTQIYSLPTL